MKSSLFYSSQGEQEPNKDGLVTIDIRITIKRFQIVCNPIISRVLIAV